jgi:hypothetical protein
MEVKRERGYKWASGFVHAGGREFYACMGLRVVYVLCACVYVCVRVCLRACLRVCMRVFSCMYVHVLVRVVGLFSFT